jgi:uncharacterized membrane protein
VTEADVALTDFALTIECAAFALALARRPRSASSIAFVAVFALSAIATALGGIVHGFAPQPDTPAYRVLWPATLVAVIGASAAMAVAAARLLGWRRAALVAIVTVALAFAAAVLSGHDEFKVAIAAYLPASLLLGAALGARRAWLGVVGLALGILAGALQQAGFTPLPRAISHNAFYHLLQMIAFGLLFFATRTSPDNG